MTEPSEQENKPMRAPGQNIVRSAVPSEWVFREAAREAAARTLARGFDYEHLFEGGENPDEPYTADYWRHGSRQILAAAARQATPDDVADQEPTGGEG